MLEEKRCQWGMKNMVSMSLLTSSSDLLASSRDTNDDALAPTLVTRLEGCPHNANIAGAVKSVVATSISHIDQPLLDRLAILEILGRVDEIRSTELGRPLLLGIIHINRNDLARAVLLRSLHDRKSNTPGAEHCNVGALLHTALAGRDGCRAVACRDAAAEQAGPVHGGLVCNGHDGDVGYDGVLREGGAAHEVQEVFALALEACGAVGHDAFALRGANLAAEVGLA